VINGLFADYYVPRLPSYLSQFTLVIDVENNAAAIPGSGDVPVAFTHTHDVAAFAASLLDLPAGTWPKKSTIVGEKLTWNQFVSALEEAKDVKFQVSCDSMDKLKKGQVTELEGQKAMYAFFPKEALQGFVASFGVMFEMGKFEVEELGPDTGFKARSVREMVREAWKKE